MEIKELLEVAIDKNASDLHLIPDYHPTLRIARELHQLNTYPIVSKTDTENMLFSILSPEQKDNLTANREMDIAYQLGNSRFRVNLYYTRKSLSASFRLISSNIQTLEELNIPNFIRKYIDIPQGLILLTGPTGEGKTTTLVSLINEINNKYSRHIITIEDPIEYIYPKSKSVVSQRELHEDTHSWNIALKSALREDPDVILVGEMRDFETIQLVLTAAETGHLVFSTLHSNSTPEAIDRMLDIFPPNQQNQIRNQLSTVLKLVVAQRLLPYQNKPGLIPALEILVNTPAVGAIIREGKTYLLNNILETSEDDGFMLFEKYLLKLYQAGKISRDTAFSYAIRPKELEKFI
ncbi:MAG: Pili biogenesis protein ATPase [Parcubacteria group bacterium GW2011_GWC2_45_7]|nr:MAG: Pili biogenesis protein ATPase [Parcubacteria group bacterium GW2011_GWC2_45_7]